MNPVRPVMPRTKSLLLSPGGVGIKVGMYVLDLVIYSQDVSRCATGAGKLVWSCSSSEPDSGRLSSMEEPTLRELILPLVWCAQMGFSIPGGGTAAGACAYNGWAGLAVSR